MGAESNSNSCPECGRDGYHSPSVTVDAVAARETENGLELLMIERGPDPAVWEGMWACLLYTSPSPRDQRGSRMPSSA